jgi:hypothetical protein
LKRNGYGVWGEIQEEREKYEDGDINVRIILKCILEKYERLGFYLSLSV